MENLTYDNSNTMIITTTPTVLFNNSVPEWFIREFLSRMAKGQIRIRDYQGNELRVYYEGDSCA